MGDQRIDGTTAPGASSHSGAESLAQLGIIWVFPFPASLTTRFDGTRMVLGRSQECDVVLQGAETSRHHAEVLRIGSQWVVHDLGSRNGVYVDAERVESSILRDGSILRIGEWIGVVGAFGLTTESMPSQFRQLAPGFVGGSHLQMAVADAERVARTCVRLVVQGETGVGKKQLARAVHQWSGRTGKFVTVNCAALPHDFAEGELFGYADGDVIGSDSAREGRLRAADKGTLLLEGVADMPLPLQPKLLQALQEQTVLPVGACAAVSLDVRVVVATHESLDRAVEQGRLRADLCAWLSVLTIIVPPVRERREDIPGLFAHLLQRYWRGPLPAVEPRLVECLCRHHWPYNVREIEQLSSYLAEAHPQETRLRTAHLPKSMRQTERPKLPCSHDQAFDAAVLHENVAREDLEKRQQQERELESLREALRLCHGNISRAATVLGISRQKIYRMMHSASFAELEELRRPTALSSAGPAHTRS